VLANAFLNSITAATQEVLATTAANFQAAEARQLQAEELVLGQRKLPWCHVV